MDPTLNIRWRGWLPPVVWGIDVFTIDAHALPDETRRRIEISDFSEFRTLSKTDGYVFHGPGLAVHIAAEFYVTYDPFTIADADDFIAVTRLFEQRSSRLDRNGNQFGWMFYYPYDRDKISYFHRCCAVYQTAFLPLCDDLQRVVRAFLV